MSKYSIELYEALSEVFPGKSDFEIGLEVGLAQSTISNLKKIKSEGLAYKAAKHIAGVDPKYKHLLDTAIDLQQRSQERQAYKAEPKTEIDLSKASTYVKNLCGFLP